MADNTYFVSALGSAAGANKRHLTIWNGTAGQELRILSVQAAGAPAATATGQVIPLYCSRITTQPTGGSDVTPVKAVASNPNVPATIECKTGATGGAAEEPSAFGVGTVSGEETASLSESVLYSMVLNGAQPVTLAPGTGMVVKQNALASAGALNLVVCVSVR
jgi:hypothetical protein